MRKIVRIGFPILCVAVVGGTLIAVGNLKKKADQIYEEKSNREYVNMVTSNNTVNEFYESGASVQNTNVVVENKAQSNNIVENVVDNQVKEKVENKVETSPKTNSNSEVTSEDLSNSSEKEKAVTLVAKEWGEDSSVYFTNEGVSNGLYIVAVRDKSNTSVKMFYKVDLKNKTVEVDW